GGNGLSDIRLKAPERLHQTEGLALLGEAARQKLGKDDRVVVELDATTAIDAKGGASLVRLSEWARSKGAAFSVEGAAGHTAEYIEIISPTLESERPALPRQEGAVEKLGGSGIAALGEFGQFLGLVNDAVY